MRTNFSLAQLANSNIAQCDQILRTCVHCGFCTATCPTYVLLGDELDSPRGRIYLIKNMLEADAPASAKVALHLDRCLSCLSCMTTCPSGVDYMHLVDHARVHVELTYRRPLFERSLRAVLALVLPRPALFRAALIAARLARPFAALAPERIAAMFALVPKRMAPPGAFGHAAITPAEGRRKLRVGLLAGCVQRVLRPEINAATIRLLSRLGCEVVLVEGVACCGALSHHLGREEAARASVRANVAAFKREIEAGGLDAIVANASGCGTMLKDYGHLMREEAGHGAAAAEISALARDVSEVVETLEFSAGRFETGLRVAYHAACSLQHGQKIGALPAEQLRRAGFEVVEPDEAHLCCGSAGTYNLLQPELAAKLRRRKLDNLERLAPDVIAAGNIGCITQLEEAVPVLHPVELLDWATGGPRPAALTGK